MCPTIPLLSLRREEHGSDQRRDSQRHCRNERDGCGGTGIRHGGKIWCFCCGRGCGDGAGGGRGGGRGGGGGREDGDRGGGVRARARKGGGEDGGARPGRAGREGGGVAGGGGASARQGRRAQGGGRGCQESTRRS